ncbi:MAG: hypothetical protein SGPRY_006765 [Prymnesium sp.]
MTLPVGISCNRQGMAASLSGSEVRSLEQAIASALEATVAASPSAQDASSFFARAFARDAQLFACYSRSPVHVAIQCEREFVSHELSSGVSASNSLHTPIISSSGDCFAHISRHIEKSIEAALAAMLVDSSQSCDTEDGVRSRLARQLLHTQGFQLVKNACRDVQTQCLLPFVSHGCAFSQSEMLPLSEDEIRREIIHRRGFS